MECFFMNFLEKRPNLWILEGAIKTSFKTGEFFNVISSFCGIGNVDGSITKNFFMSSNVIKGCWRTGSVSDEELTYAYILLKRFYIFLVFPGFG